MSSLVRGTSSDLVGLICFAATIDLVQFIFGLTSFIPFIGLLIGLTVPSILSLLGFVLFLFLKGEQVSISTGSKKNAKLKTAIVVCFVEMVPFLNIGFGFTFGIVSILKSIRKEEKEETA